MKILLLLVWTIRSVFVNKSHLIMENLALRQQLIVMKRSIKRSNVRIQDRLFWETYRLTVRC